MVTTRAWSAAASVAMVLLTPPAAWWAWISWSDDKAGDAMHVAWFATVAVGCVLAGTLTPRGKPLLPTALAATLSTLLTLWLWWAGEDESGLFVIGFAIATPPVAAASLPLLLLGRALGSRGGARRT